MRTLARFLISAALVMTAAIPTAAAPAGRVVLLSLDGGGEQLMEQMLAEGRMPNLAAMAKAGVAADYSRTHFTTKTAAGHAALWTGTWGSRNGVTANRVPMLPKAEHTILEARSGFDARVLEAEPVFVTAARAGKRVMAMNLAQTLPLATFGPEGRFGKGVGDRLFIFSGFDSTPVEEGTWSESLGVWSASDWTHLPASDRPPLASRYEIGGQPVFALLIGDPADPAPGYDTCMLTHETNAATPLACLKPESPGRTEAWSPLVPIRAGAGLWGTYFRLFDLSPDGQQFLLYHSAPSAPFCSRPEWLPAYYQAGGGHVEGAGAISYARGRFGPTLAEDGDGTAEARFLDTLRFALHRMRETSGHFMGEHGWDLFMHYLPVPDEAGHLWQGYLLPGTPAYDEELAQRLWPFMRAVYQEIDAYVGSLRQAMPADASLVIVSDHGMAAAQWDFFPNVVLRQAGLLCLDAAGQVDLSRTKAMYSPNDGGYIVVNTLAHKGGIVPPKDVPKVLESVRQALKAIQVKAPGGTVPLVTAMLAPTPQLSEELGLGGPNGGDLYLDLQPGYFLNAGLAGENLFRPRPANAMGSHVFDSRRADLHAIFYAAGPGFKRGATVPAIRNIDVAPTIARLLGIPKPAQATGRVVTEALAP